MNSEDVFGIFLRLQDGGDTHQKEMWGMLENFPAGIFIDNEFIDQELLRRSPSKDINSTQRRERDEVVFLSGIDEQGFTTGDIIRFIVPNKDVQVNSSVNTIIKPSHSSFVYKEKYGAQNNEECGRASARQTVCRVVAGALAKLLLRKMDISICAETISTANACKEGDTLGAKVRCTIHNVPVGLGEPVYDKLSARLAFAIMSINAAKGFEIGEGFAAAGSCGSEYNDTQNPDFSFNSNHDGGIQAGISNGQDIIFNVAFKPIPSLQMEQKTIDFEGNPTTYKASNRNDRCVVPRVLPVVEAMAALVIADFYLIKTKNEKLV